MALFPPPPKERRLRFATLFSAHRSGPVLLLSKTSLNKLTQILYTRSLDPYLLGRVELSGCDLLCTRLVRNDPLLDLICRVVGSEGVHSECLQEWVARQVRLQFSPHI